MTKQIEATTELTGKMDRMTLKVTFLNGEVLRFKTKDGNEQLLTAQPPKFKGTTPSDRDLTTLLRYCTKYIIGESTSQRLKRLAREFETNDSIVAAARCLAA